MKKLSLALVLTACLFAFTGCGEVERVDEQTSTLLGDESVQIIENAYTTLDSATVAEIVGRGPEMVEYAFEQAFGIKVDGNGVGSGMESYVRAVDEIGSLVSINSYTAEYETSGDGIIIKVNCSFELKDADIEFVYGTDLYNTLESSATNIDYTFGEKMAKAGLNTIMGMGTVFVVLILIYGIISLFSFIPKIQDSFNRKNVTPVDAKESVDNAITHIEKSEELSDDLELIAVITAAIAASEGSESADGYVVRSIKRVNKSKWRY